MAPAGSRFGDRLARTRAGLDRPSTVDSQGSGGVNRQAPAAGESPVDSQKSRAASRQPPAARRTQSAASNEPGDASESRARTRTRPQWAACFRRRCGGDVSLHWNEPPAASRQPPESQQSTVNSQRSGAASRWPICDALGRMSGLGRACVVEAAGESGIPDCGLRTPAPAAGSEAEPEVVAGHVRDQVDRAASHCLGSGAPAASRQPPAASRQPPAASRQP
jgi:hypothetical protein